MGLHTERTEELNPTDEGTRFRELSVAKENEDMPIRLSIDTTKVMACVVFFSGSTRIKSSLCSSLGPTV